jgi:hypothetical protein
MTGAPPLSITFSIIIEIYVSVAPKYSGALGCDGTDEANKYPTGE